MLLKNWKSKSSGLCEAAKTLCILALKDVDIGFVSRSFHNGKSRPFVLTRNVALKPNKSLVTLSRFYSTPAQNQDVVSLNESSDTETSSEDGKTFLKKHSITVLGKNVPPPILSIEEAGFPDDILNILQQRGVVTPTPIQSVSWPIVLDRRDFVGISPTGSGKTLAFAVPAVMRVKQLKADKGITRSTRSPYALILTPTRELAQQILQIMMWFRGPSLRVVALYGGVSKGPQRGEIERGVDIIIATPGRCKDFLDYDEIDLERCSFLVLDEADRMLDMGFLPQIEPIIESISCERQSMMWSATWPKEVREIAARFMNNYIHVAVGSMDLKPCDNVNQSVVICEDWREKQKKLLEFLEDVTQSPDAKVLVFAETKGEVDRLDRSIRNAGFGAASIHGDKSQNMREAGLRKFRSGHTKILVATAVAARGLDIDKITHVVNYDCPRDSDEYVHKIGRTGRLNNKGEAITYVTLSDTFAGYLVKMLRDSNREVPRELLSFKGVNESRRFDYNAKRHNPYFMKGRDSRWKQRREPPWERRREPYRGHDEDDWR